MNQFKYNRFIMYGALTLTGVAAISGISSLALVFGGVALLQLRALKASTEIEMTHASIQAVKRTFESLNVVMFDKHWIGARATVAKVIHRQIPTVETNGLSVVQVMAIAQGGNWFVLDMSVSRAKNVNVINLQQLSEPEAKFMLASDLEAYETFFGKPVVA